MSLQHLKHSQTENTGYMNKAYKTKPGYINGWMLYFDKKKTNKLSIINLHQKAIQLLSFGSCYKTVD